MASSPANVLLIAKVLILLIIFVTIIITCLLSKPISESADSQAQPITHKTRDTSAEQARLHALSEIVKQNSEILPDRTNNLTARELCKRRNMCAPKNRRYETMLRVSPNYKMVNCVVQKSMSTMMTGTMCYLYDEVAFLETGRSFDDEFDNRFCREKNEFFSTNDVRDFYNISLIKNDWSFSMVTRDPIDRFVSGYVDRCVRLGQSNETIQCNGCGLNMTCFIEKEYERLMTISGRGKVRRTMEDAHFFPQIWHCDLHEEFEYFEFLRYSRDAEEMLLPQLDDLLQRQNVPDESRKHIRSQLKSRRPNHSTIDTPARRFYYTRLMSSPYLLEYIVRMFYYDFVQFHYDLPEGF